LTTRTRFMSPDATRGGTVTDELRALGTRGVLVQMAQRGQIIELRCEMPMCYCDKGWGYFDPRSTPLTDWAPSPDHYPRLKADGGHLVPWNVRLSHVLCNRMDFGWRMRIRRMLEKGMSLEDIAENLTHERVRRPHGSSRVGHSGAKGVRLLNNEIPYDPTPFLLGMVTATTSCKRQGSTPATGVRVDFLWCPPAERGIFVPFRTFSYPVHTLKMAWLQGKRQSRSNFSFWVR
jgi:hypothetical protein